MTLDANRAHLEAAGVAYLPLAVTRRLLKRPPRPGLAQRGLGRLLPALRRMADARALHRAILAGIPRADRLVISDENLLGLSHQFRSGLLYPDPDGLCRVQAAARGARTELFLAVRSLDRYLPSLYAEAIKFRPLDRSVLAARVDALSHTPLVWSDLVDWLSATFPQSAIRVWRHEDYGGNWEAIYRTLTGIAPAVPPPESRPILTRTPGEAAIRAAEAMLMKPGEGRDEKVREIYAADIEAGASQRFDPLSETEKRRFRDAYLEDIDLIRRAHPGVLLEF